MNGPDFDSVDLIPAVVQDRRTGAVLMLGYMNEEAYNLTVSTREVHFWSRSRQELWRKGATSGNTLAVNSIVTDCDRDAILVSADPAGPTCHTGDATCFTKVLPAGFRSIDDLWTTIQERGATRPPGSYTTTLLEGGVDEVGRKVLEEAGEVTFAAKDHAAGNGHENRVVEEAADLLYHLLVLLTERGIEAGDVLAELAGRAAGTGTESS